MHQRQLDTVRHYLTQLQAGNTAAMIDAFEVDGLVHSPFLGEMPARDFFLRLAQASRQSVITVHDLFFTVQPTEEMARAAAYFRYDWTLADGRVVSFNCVDLFEFHAGSDRIDKMRIVYDTHPLRERVGGNVLDDR